MVLKTHKPIDFFVLSLMTVKLIFFFFFLFQEVLRNSSDPDPKPDQVPDSDFWPDPDLVNMDPSKILLKNTF